MDILFVTGGMLVVGIAVLLVAEWKIRRRPPMRTEQQYGIPWELDETDEASRTKD